jgi:hypothetical protein
MNEADYQILARFLEAFGPEAEGHGDGADETFVHRLETLVSGKCSQEERRAICAAVEEHRNGARLLADLIRARRVPGGEQA